MADDDEVGEEFPFDPTFAATGPRRSTFTPPTAAVPQPEVLHDDDALADALAADLSRVASFPASTPAAPVTPETEPDPTPAVDEPPVSSPEPEYPSYAATPPVADTPEAPNLSDYAPPRLSDSAMPGLPPPSAPPAWPAPSPAPWSAFPAPDPAQAVQLPEPTDQQYPTMPPPAPPTREPSPTLDLIEQLQARLEQREREARERAGNRPVSWPFASPPVPAPEAVAEEQEPPAPAEVPEPDDASTDAPSPAASRTPAAMPTAPISFVDPESPVTAWPFPSFGGEPAAPLPYNDNPDVAEPKQPYVDTVEPPPASPVRQEPVAPEPIAEPPASAPFEPVTFEQAPLESESFVPTADIPAAPLDDPFMAPDAAAFDRPADDEATPTPPLPAWEVPAPGPNWTPAADYDPDAEIVQEPMVVEEPTVAEVPTIEPAAEAAEPSWQPFENLISSWEQAPAPEAPQPVAEDLESAAPQPEATRPDDTAAALTPADVTTATEATPWPESMPQPPAAPEPIGAPVFEAEPVAEPESVFDASPVFDATPAPAPDAPLSFDALLAPPVETAAPAQEPAVLAPEPPTEAVAPAPELPVEAAAPASEPPPLIEPLVEPTRHGVPLLPSQTASLPPLARPDIAPPPPSEQVDAFPPPSEPASTFPPPPSETLEAPQVREAAAGHEFSFDDLLSGAAENEAEPDEEPLLRRDPEPASVADSTPEAIFIEPMPVAPGEPVPDTGSIRIVDQAYDEEPPDDVDETDRVFQGLGPVSVDTSGIAVVTGAIVQPPSGPISTARIPEDETVLLEKEPVKMKVFSLEDSGLDATPVDHRIGRAARLFWLWFAANSSIISLGLGASVFAVGMSLRQSIVSILAGVALSFIPLGLTTLAGKRSGQPTMVVSRATFGLLGNVVPAILALVSRVFWGAVLLWLLASSVTIVLVGGKLGGPIGERQLLLISLAVAFLIALLVAFAGYPLFARIQLILSVISAVLVVGLIAMTWKYVNFSTALGTPDGPWLLTISGAVLVFSVVGLVWANSGADLARYQRPTSSGAASMLWATVGATLPTFILIGYGTLLAASDPTIATGFLGSPLDTLARMLPLWYPVPLLAATALSLLSGIILTLYSGGFALQAIGLRVRRQWSIVIVGVLLGGVALLLTFGVPGGINELLRDGATTLAVPTAAWAGIFAAETMIRNRRFDSQSLLVRGGVYADVRWLNLISLIVISVIGFGLTTATVTWLSWQGYGFSLLGMPLDSDLAASDLGVLVALVLGLLVPLAGGIPAIRRQEALRG